MVLLQAVSVLKASP